MLKKKLLMLLALVGCAFSIGVVFAQDETRLCPLLVEQTQNILDEACADTPVGRACFIRGNIELVADREVDFESPGDMVDVELIERLTLTPADVQTGAWGVVLIRLASGLENEAITLILAGDVELWRTEGQRVAIYPSVIRGRSTGSVNVRSGPSTSTRIAGALVPGQTVFAYGRNEDASWLRIYQPDGIPGWVFADLLTTSGDTDRLAVVDAEDTSPPVNVFEPLEAFHFRSGMQESLCETFHPSGIYVETPEGSTSHLLVNDLYLTFQSEGVMQATGEGTVVTTQSGTITVKGVQNTAYAEGNGTVKTVSSTTTIEYSEVDPETGETFNYREVMIEIDPDADVEALLAEQGLDVDDNTLLELFPENTPVDGAVNEGETGEVTLNDNGQAVDLNVHPTSPGMEDALNNRLRLDDTDSVLPDEEGNAIERSQEDLSPVVTDPNFPPSGTWMVYHQTGTIVCPAMTMEIPASPSEQVFILVTDGGQTMTVDGMEGQSRTFTLREAAEGGAVYEGVFDIDGATISYELLFFSDRSTEIFGEISAETEGCQVSRSFLAELIE